MPAVLFDTLRLSRTLREKGHFSAEQAETLAEATHEDLATKPDVAALKAAFTETKAELKTEIAETKAELKTDIAELKTEIAEVKAEISIIKAEMANLATKSQLAEVKAEILKWMVGAIGFQTAAILATIVGLVRIFAK
ncbi:MAG: CCDC90 family protein [Beijerinckiaceae bacterium]|nr:CCDC90 family protein [Beijerinckiaceae bacterium]